MDQIHSLLFQGHVVFVLGADAVKPGRTEHTDEEVGVPEPLNAFVAAPDVAENDFGIEVVDELARKLTLDGQLLVEQRQVVRDLILIGDDDTLAVRVELGTTGTAEHLEDILGTQLNPATLLGRVDLCALDDDGVRRQVDTPSEGCRAHKDLDMAARK